MSSHHNQQQPRSNKNRASQNQPHPINLSYTNVRGLRTNFSSIQSFLHVNSPDLLALCETNLDDSISDREFDVPGYSTLITKHDHLNRHLHGLGVYIKDGLPCARDISHEELNSPYMCFRMALLHSTTYIFFLYRPQTEGSSVFTSIANQIDDILINHPSANINVFGDFNVHHVQWLTHSNHTDNVGVECFNFSLAYELKQIIPFPTRVPDTANHFPSLLDLFLTSVPEFCTPTRLPPLGSSDHCVVSVSIDMPSKCSSEVPFHRTSYRYAQADWDNFRSYIADGPFNFFFKFRASKLTSLISDWIRNGIELFIPHKTYQQKPHSQPWFTAACAAAIAHRNHFFHEYNRNPSNVSKSNFRTASNRCKYTINQAKTNYANLIKLRIEAQNLGTREFWRITNSVMNRGKSSIPTIVNGPEIISSSLDKARLFAKMFSSNSILNDDGHPLPDFPHRTDINLSNLKVTPSEVAKLIRQLEPSKAVGPDEIPVVVLKELSAELSPILSKLFNKCIRQSCFPVSWKKSSVCPVFKNAGERCDPTKYRPISLLPIMSKVFESIINNFLISNLEKSSLLSDVQYGFRSSRSTADILTVITDRISRSLDLSFETRSVALDISKAFDKVWHKGLLHKLQSYGITGKILAVIKSFLSNRKMKVVLDGQSSQFYFLNAGVPQGSVLGPTLFLIYINDLPDNILSSFIDIFADDSTIYSSSTSTQSLDSIAQNLSSDLASVVTWGEKWLVSFNATKTKSVSFHHHRQPDFSVLSMNGVDLVESDSHDRLLGLTLSSDLKWDTYIARIAKNASKMVGSFYRSRNFLSPSSILYLYKSQIRPTMEYCCHLWAGASHRSLSALDSVQHRLKGLVGPDLYSTLQPLSHRRDVASISLFYRYFHGKCSTELHSLVPPLRVFRRQTRYSNDCAKHPFFLQIPKSHHKFHETSFIPRTTKLWNSLPPEAFPDEYNINKFKSNANKFLLTLN